ncbi:MAG: vitamin B12-dependent ribonucleotide reductase [Patescibacteria group bacterium]
MNGTPAYPAHTPSLDARPSVANGHAHTARAQGFTWQRLFGAGDPYDAITWEKRTAKITKSDGTVVFEQRDIEVPNFWSQTATDIVASKYFRGKLGTPEREISVKQMIDRVAKTIGSWAHQDGYFTTVQDAEHYTLDLTWLLVNQYFSFNSPVWFNVGVFERPQCSACFILAVEDNMQSILEWFRDEGIIFKGGSGSGVDVSKIRSSKEQLSKGGYSSGPVSFMKGADGVANTIRSGGTTRRAAKMVVMNVDHPDLKDFIYAKQHIENMTRVLVQNGFANTLDGDLFSPYTLLPYQNANNSVRVTDEFMHAVEQDQMWDLRARVSGETLEHVRAREIIDWIADAAWHSADPGMQYDTTINRWHTCPNAGRINASNPCSEYMHLDNSACNLASLNLLRFLSSDGRFNIELFKRAVDTVILAQDIVIDRSSYPTEKITANARAYRELGLGYANLGSLLMVLGLPYDSDEGRMLAGQITSLMCGEAYRMSGLLADVKGPYDGYAKNKEPQLNVITMHLHEAERLYAQATHSAVGGHDLQIASRMVWHEALETARMNGVRNSQMTVLAPTGTIAFMMDCDTTGVEPDIALIKYKKLVGGGTLKLVNSQVPVALARLGYNEDNVQRITAHLMKHDTIEGAPGLKEKHLAVFDCAFRAANGIRSISYLGHLRMMAAAQPFISGAISKTINLPADATREDVKDAFMHGWKLGLKAIAVYRDGSKSVQPLNTKKEEKNGHPADVRDGFARVRLPEERPAITHKFSVAGYEGYLTVGLYPDTQKPGETFLSIAKEGSTVSGLLNTIAILTSMCLQSGIPLKMLVRKFKDMSFAPAGFTENPDIPMAKSIIDYMFRYMGMRFLSREDRDEIFGSGHAAATSTVAATDIVAPARDTNDAVVAQLASLPPLATGNGNGHHSSMSARPVSNADAPACQCGTLMVRTGACYTCPSCGTTSGVCS